ncbi:Membrane protein OS=Streptomyces fumanus OX=67302 GN=GCM10018772_53900 PE=4 SV=1 [Streptomyces fumanus]
MAALARWCVQRRLVTVLLWLLALAGTTAGAAALGSAYSNDYGVPGTESDRAARLLDAGFPGRGGDSDILVWHTGPDAGTVRAAAVEQTMTRTLDRVGDLPGVASVTNPYDDPGTPSVSEDGRTAYAVVTFDRQAGDIPDSQARAVADAAAAARADGLQVELGGAAVSVAEAPGGHLAEAVGVAVAAVVLFLAFGTLAASLLPIATALVSVGTAYAGVTQLGHAMHRRRLRAACCGTLLAGPAGTDYALVTGTRVLIDWAFDERGMHRAERSPPPRTPPV